MNLDCYSWADNVCCSRFGMTQRPEGSSFLSDLNQKLLLPQNEASVAGTRYNVPLINSLVFYVGIQVSFLPVGSH
jgi:hypothetical protein